MRYGQPVVLQCGAGWIQEQATAADPDGRAGRAGHAGRAQPAAAPRPARRRSGCGPFGSAAVAQVRLAQPAAQVKIDVRQKTRLASLDGRCQACVGSELGHSSTGQMRVGTSNVCRYGSVLYGHA